MNIPVWSRPMPVLVLLPACGGSPPNLTALSAPTSRAGLTGVPDHIAGSVTPTTAGEGYWVPAPRTRSDVSGFFRPLRR